MKNTRLYAIPVTMAILALLCGNTGQVFASQEHEHEEYEENDEDYQRYGEHQLAGQIKIYMHYDQDVDYYGDAVITTNGHETKFDFHEDAGKFFSPMWKIYYYYGYIPDEDEVCLENLDSHRKNCVDVYRGEQRVDINMPD